MDVAAVDAADVDAADVEAALVVAADVVVAAATTEVVDASEEVARAVVVESATLASPPDGLFV